MTLGRLDWYRRRLLAMEPAEAVVHGRRAVMHRLDDQAWRWAPALWKRAWQPASLDELTPSALSIGPLRRDRVEEARSVLAAEREEIVGEAERRLEGRVQVLGYPELTLSPSRGDTADPISGRAWPDRQGRLIDYRRDGPGDPKLVWELNRCQELPLLVLAWRLTGRERFAEEAARRMTRWVIQNPPGRGVAWANAFEPGLRALSLSLALDGLRGSPALHADDARAILRGLWQHGRWIVRDHSTGSSANNHLLGELVGLLAIAVLAPELPESESWRALAIGRIAREADFQVLPDGGGAEQAFEYMLFVADLLLVASALVETAQLPTEPALTAAVERTGAALGLLIAEDEPEPAYGDADDGRALVLDGRSARHARRVAAGIAACVGHGDARRLAETPDPTAAILFGGQGLRRFAATQPAASPGSGVLRDSGLVVLRDGSSRALFDVGPLGYLSLAAHGHADALQVVVSHGANELISDPGTGSYFGDPPLRDRLRGTRAHATVTVDDIDQSERGGPFLWTRHGDARLLHWDARLDLAIGEHDGYAELAPPVFHRRAVRRIGAGAFLVVDWLCCEGERSYRQSWPLHPTLVPERTQAGVIARKLDEDSLLVKLVATEPADVDLRPDGRWSRRLETSEPAWRIEHVVAAPGQVYLVALVVADPGEPDDVLLTLERDGSTCVVGFRVNEREGQHAFTLESTPPRVA